MPAAAFETTVGWLRVVQSGEVITRVSWCAPAAIEPAATPLLAEVGRQLGAYFDGRLRDFELALDPAGSGFQRSVWREMTRIPYGEVLTYGEMAAKVDGVARAVGGACGANPIPVIIPCHRVVAGGGGLGGYSGQGGPETKRQLLIFEGALPPELPL